MALIYSCAIKGPTYALQALIGDKYSKDKRNLNLDAFIPIPRPPLEDIRAMGHWRDKCSNLWGCQYTPSIVNYFTEGEDTIILFESAWGVPVHVFDLMSALYPEAVFNVAWGCTNGVAHFGLGEWREGICYYPSGYALLPAKVHGIGSDILGVVPACLEDNVIMMFRYWISASFAGYFEFPPDPSRNLDKYFLEFYGAESLEELVRDYL